MTFKERVRALGFNSYDDYLAGDHWQEFRERYRTNGRSMRCAVCLGKPIQLHHHTYDRLGEERLEDVTPLCRAHHTEVHARLKAAKKFVQDTPWAIAEIQAGTAVVAVTKRAARAERKKAKRARKKARDAWKAKEAAAQGMTLKEWNQRKMRAVGAGKSYLQPQTPEEQKKLADRQKAERPAAGSTGKPSKQERQRRHLERQAEEQRLKQERKEAHRLFLRSMTKEQRKAYDAEQLAIKARCREEYKRIAREKQAERDRIQQIKIEAERQRWADPVTQMAAIAAGIRRPAAWGNKAGLTKCRKFRKKKRK